MNLQYTEDGCLKLQIENENVIDDEAVQIMNENAYLLPSLKEQLEESTIIYHIGTLTAMSDYLEKKTLDMQECTRIVLNMVEAFIKIKETGLKQENVITQLDYIYIDPRTKEMRMVYCPVFSKVEFAGLPEMLKNFCWASKTKNAEMLLGTLMQYANAEEKASYGVLKDTVEKIGENGYVREVEKIIEKPVERIVERVIEKTVDNDQNKVMVYTILLLYAFFMLGFPYVLAIHFGSSLVTVPKILNFLLFLLAALVDMIFVQRFTKFNHGEKMVVTVQKPNDMVDTPLDYKKEMNASAVLYEESRRLKENRKKNLRYDMAFMESRDIYDMTLRREREPLEGTTILRERKAKAYLLKEGKTSVMDRIYLREDVTLIGREETADFRMNDSAVSKRHAKIVQRNNKFYISDLDSSNGTFLNNFKIEPYEEYELKSGSRITFGDLHYFFYI